MIKFRILGGLWTAFSYLVGFAVGYWFRSRHKIRTSEVVRT